MADVTTRSPERHGGANRTLALIVILGLVVLAFLVIYVTKSGHHEGVANTSQSAPQTGTTSGGTTGQ